MFRGGQRLAGVSAGSLPEKPTVQWTFRAADAIASSAAIARGTVFFGSDDGLLYALRLVDGSLKWKWPPPPASQPTTQAGPPAIQSSPCVWEGRVYFGDQDGIFHALDEQTGRELWRFQTGGEIISSANCAADRVLFGSYDGHLYCLARDDGRLLWKFETEGRVHGTPGVAGEIVVVAGCDERLRVLKVADGSPVRDVSLGGYSGASAALDGDRVFVGTFSNQVLGVDWKAGRRLWTYENPDRQFPFYSSAAVAGKSVIIGGRDKDVRALDADSGKSLWSFTARGRVDSSPVVVGRRVYVGSSDGCLYGLDLATGREAWRFEAGSPISASPAVGEGRLVVGTEDGVLYCFGSG
jgi:outer membrane protein assembly factor BamB